MNGILIVNKEKNMTSHDVVSRVRRLYNMKRVGHAGTLDPMATGVLPVLLGSAAAASDIVMNHDKLYRFGLRLGTVTDTGDITGKTLKIDIDTASLDALDEAAESFVGDYMQTPPMYSAIKIDGKKLCDLAREGKSVERKPRNIKIYSLKRTKILNGTDYLFDVFCSKGTYVRTLCEDIGKKLGCGATMLSLERLSCGEFDISQGHTLSEIEAAENRENFLIPTEKIFEKYPIVRLNGFYSTLCKNGAEIYLERAEISEEIFSDSVFCRLYDDSGSFFALGEKKLFEEGNAIKAAIRFDTKNT